MEKYIQVYYFNGNKNTTIIDTIKMLEKENPKYDFVSLCGHTLLGDSAIMKLKEVEHNKLGNVDPLSLLSSEELKYYKEYEEKKNHNIKSTPENIINGIKSALVAVDAININNSGVVNKLLDTIVLTEIRLLINKNR